MDEISPLLTSELPVDLPSPNLTPRHRELIPTPCGPIKPWSELTCLVKVYFSFTITSLVAVLVLTLVNASKQFQRTESYEEESVSLILIVGILFCLYYITRGILQENQQELIAFVLSVLVVMVRSVVNFSVLPRGERKGLLLVRFASILCVGLLHIICATLLIRRPNMMAFRVGGALESLQEQYFLLNLCFSMVTFDLQAQLCLCILIITSSMSLSQLHIIILGFGVIWACVTASVGAIAVLKEVKTLVWIYAFLNLPELAYFIYLLYTVIVEWGLGKSYSQEAAVITGSCISALIKAVLLGSLYRLYHSFGQGLRERMFASSRQ